MNDLTTTTQVNLENRFKNVWQFLKTTRFKSPFHKQPKALIKLPWYLLIGPSGAGKTQLIQQAGLKLIPAAHLATAPQDESADNKHGNFWFSENATIIDIPGTHFTTIDHPEGQSFFAFLKKYLRRKPLAGILMTINLAEWAIQTKKQQQTFITQVKKSLHTITQALHIQACPLYFIFTHVDCIHGFNEFFAELGHEEREQPWGITFTPQTTNNVTATFKTHYDRLLKRLHERVIWRLQHERNAEKHSKIQGFPLQMELLKESIANCLYQCSDLLVPHGVLSCAGIYFVSNLQTGMVVDTLQKQYLSHALAPTTPQLVTQHQATQAYFSHRLFKKIIFDHPFQIGTQTSQHFRREIYWAITGVVIVSTLFLGWSFNTKTAELHKAEIALAEYREAIQKVPVQDHDLNHNLAPLQYLKTAANYLQQAHLPWLMLQGLRQPHLETITANTYQSELNLRFLPSIGASLEQLLSSNTDPTVVYGALKVYLMLGTPQHYDPVFIQNWLQNYWQESFKQNPTAQQQLKTHLTALLAKPILPLTLNTERITQARHTLNNAQPTQLTYAILKNAATYTFFNPLLMQNNDRQSNDKKWYSAIFANVEQIGIASMYTRNQFQDIYFHKIKAAADLALQGDWVIGKKNGGNTNTDEELVKAVQIFYLKNYAYQWQVFLNNLQITNFKNITAFHQVIDALLQQPSPLNHLLTIVANNTSLSYLLPANQTFPTTDLKAIQTYLVTPFNELQHFASNTQPTLNALNALKNFMHDLDDATAFKVAKQKFTSITQNGDAIDQLLTQAQNTPPLVQNWLTHLADNSWHTILQMTKNHLNTAWKKEVLEEYQANIQNRYPIFKDAQTDITLANFVHFFGPTGTVHNYFVTYLAPFVDTNTPTWQWRISHNGKLSTNNDFLLQLERAAIIKTMFFNNQQFQVNFALRLQSLAPEAKQFEFVLNEQSFTDKKWDKTKHNFTWPNLGKTQTTSLTFTNNANEKKTLAFNGTWGLLKLLDKSLVNAEEESDQHFEITFNVNGLSARYDLTANTVVNPFMPNIINAFRCPVDF